MKPPKRISCASNLSQIGKALYLYANANGGKFPDSLDQLILTRTVSPSVFICEIGDEEKAPGKTPAEMANNFAAGAHSSYIYLGKRIGSDVSPDTVVAYERRRNHQGEGGNILFGDGHVKFMSGSDPIWRALPPP